MKRYSCSALLLFLVLLSVPGPVLAQDAIIYLNGDEYQVIIKDVGPDAIKYVRYSTPDGPVITVPKSEIYMIRYKDGKREVITEYGKAKKTEMPSPEEREAAIEREEEPPPAEKKVRSGYQDKFQVRAQGIVGGTLGDIEKYWDWNDLYDWDQFTYGFDVQVLYRLSPLLLVGVEYSAHRLFWYETRHNYGYQSYYSSGNEWSSSPGVIADFSDDRFFFQAGFNINTETDIVSATLAPGIKLKIADHIWIPFGLRADYMLKDNGLATAALTVGVIIH